MNKFLKEKYLKSIPLYEFAGSGYTNKDLLISFITGFPLTIKGFGIIKTYEEYKELENEIVFFNVGIKMITILHEFIIHLFFGYLNFI